MTYGDVTREDSQRRFLAQLSVATLLRHCFEWLQHCSNIAMLCCAKNRRCESSRVTSPLQLKTTTGGLKYFALDERATKNHPGGIRDLEDETQSVMMAWPANPRCPVACLEKYLAKRDPRCDVSWQKPKNHNAGSFSLTDQVYQVFQRTHGKEQA